MGVMMDDASLLDRWKLVHRAASDPSLPLIARAILPLVLEGVNRQTGTCAYAVRTFAGKIRTEPKRIRAALASLAEAGYLTIEQRGGEITPHGRTNAYRPIYVKVAEGITYEGALSPPRVVSMRGQNPPLDISDEGAKTPPHEGAKSTPIPSYLLPSKKEGATDKGDSTSPAAADAPHEDATKIATEFWDRYPASPRKDDKANVFRKIERLITKEGIKGANILAGLAGYAKSPDALKGGKGEFVKAPMVFLNKRTWETFLATSRQDAARAPGPLAIKTAADAARIYDVGAG
jgi:hypothetical protein